ncbi:MAG: DUF4476 domain-containing protein [Bacteroidetes bacterium]|nr:DUF4476 domain-containing protein [Bacteroidota bacterium]
MERLSTAFALCLLATLPAWSQTEPDTPASDEENVNMHIDVNGQQLNMNMQVSGNSTTTTTRTTTTTTTVTSDPPAAEPVPVPAAHPGSPCGAPMDAGDFNEARTSIAGKGFEETKLTVAKQVADNNCLTTAQVKQVMGLFGFEETKLTFAKYAYDRTYDRKDYYKINDAFGFESSVDDLNEYLRSR